MKYLILLISCAFIVSSSSLAQGNLQFNQVILETFSGATSSTSAVYGTITIPAGKVWKIERTSLSSVSNSTLSLYPVTSSSYYMYIGDYLAYNASTTIGQSLYPIWLPSGTYNVNGFLYSGANYNFVISAIEFNVIP